MTRAAPPAGAGAPARPLAGHASRIFICYRRRDAQQAASRLYESLGQHFGEDRIFRDLDDIKGGADWEEVIRHELESCGAAVVIIGERWLAAEAEGRRRLNDPADYVRREVAIALARGIFVVPVLVDGAEMPRAHDLPDDLKPLTRRNAEVLSDRHWAADVKRLIDVLDPPSRLLGWWRRRFVRVAVAALALAAALLAQYRWAYRAQPADLVSTVIALRGHEELVIEGPLTNSAEGLVFSRNGRANEFVDLDFERARLGEETHGLLVRLKFDPPRDPADLKLKTLPPEEPPEEGEGPGAAASRPAGERKPAPARSPASARRPAVASAPEAARAAGETCRTALTVRAARADAPPTALHLYQSEAVGERFRKFYLKAAGGELHVRALTALPTRRAPEGLGCLKRLLVGGKFKVSLPSPSNVNAVAEAGGGVLLSFGDATPGGPPWDGAGERFRPFELGGGVAEPGGPAPLRAAAVHVNPLGNGASATRSLTAAGEPLSINSLEIGPDHIQLGVSGRAFEKTAADGYEKLATRLKRHPFAAALFVALDLALVAWLLGLLFGPRHHHA